MNTSKDMYAYVERWLNTSKIQKEYLKELNISKDSFSYWVNNYRRDLGINKSNNINTTLSEYLFKFLKSRQSTKIQNIQKLK